MNKPLETIMAFVMSNMGGVELALSGYDVYVSDALGAVFHFAFAVWFWLMAVYWLKRLGDN